MCSAGTSLSPEASIAVDLCQSVADESIKRQRPDKEKIAAGPTHLGIDQAARVGNGTTAVAAVATPIDQPDACGRGCEPSPTIDDELEQLRCRKVGFGGIGLPSPVLPRAGGPRAQ